MSSPGLSLFSSVRLNALICLCTAGVWFKSFCKKQLELTKTRCVERLYLTACTQHHLVLYGDFFYFFFFFLHPQTCSDVFRIHPFIPGTLLVCRLLEGSPRRQRLRTFIANVWQPGRWKVQGRRCLNTSGHTGLPRCRCATPTDACEVSEAHPGPNNLLQLEPNSRVSTKLTTNTWQGFGVTSVPSSSFLQRSCRTNATPSADTRGCCLLQEKKPRFNSPKSSFLLPSAPTLWKELGPGGEAVCPVFGWGTAAKHAFSHRLGSLPSAGPAPAGAATSGTGASGHKTPAGRQTQTAGREAALIKRLLGVN